MKYHEILTLLSENMYPECWVNSRDNEGLDTYTLRENIGVSIVELPEEEESKVSNEFTERFMNESAYLRHYSLKYNGSTVKNILLFLVDGGRAFIPSPKLIDRNYIHDDDLIISVIIDRLAFDSRYESEDTTRYLDRAKLSYQKSILN
ncbi:hypothetical protein [Cytobacillus oceanisediminis]|uniref:Uncharacterized protein n=1 Tax=Cytobacillus oceanisediminis TaxID=665099 RepID=A0ABX3CL75_9BACI|nr:hypothetical protein [Cytobacillus oceanisediminis]OHX41682.1 hypothetical protein BBV17_27985 [Cytobacillus oceanisediminis]